MTLLESFAIGMIIGTIYGLVFGRLISKENQTVQSTNGKS